MHPNQPDGGKAKRVVIYSAPWCAICKRAKRFLQNKSIPFRELDIEKNRMAQRELERMNARGVPVILIGDKRMNGFSEKRFMELYTSRDHRNYQRAKFGRILTDRSKCIQPTRAK